MKKISILIFVCLCFCANSVLSQKYWTRKHLQSHTGRYNYVVGEGKSYIAASTNAFKQMQSMGGTINIDTEIASLREYVDDQFNNKDAIRDQLHFNKQSKKYRLLDRDYSATNKTHYVLMAMPAKENYALPRKFLLNRRPQAFGLSLVIPGGGQMLKNQVGRGIFLLLGIGGGITTALVFDNLKKKKNTLAEQAESISAQEEYKRSARKHANQRNIAVLGAVVLYGINLLDAAMSKSRVYASVPKRKQKYRLIANYDLPSQTAQLGIRWQLGK